MNEHQIARRILMDEMFGKLNSSAKEQSLHTRRSAIAPQANMDSTEWNKFAHQYMTHDSFSNTTSTTKGTNMYTAISTKKIIVAIKNKNTSDMVMIALPFSEGLLSTVDQMEIVETGDRYSSIEASGVRLSTGTKTIVIVEGTSIKESRESEDARKAREETKRLLEIESLESRLAELKGKE